jgi:hypothetical protein
MQVGTLGHQHGGITYTQVGIITANFGDGLVCRVLAQLDQAELNVIHAECFFAVASEFVKKAQGPGSALSAGAGALNAKVRATAGDSDIASLFNLMQVFVERAAQAGQLVVVHRL